MHVYVKCVRVRVRSGVRGVGVWVSLCLFVRVSECLGVCEFVLRACMHAWMDRRTDVCTYPGMCLSACVSSLARSLSLSLSLSPARSFFPSL